MLCAGQSIKIAGFLWLNSGCLYPENVSFVDGLKSISYIAAENEMVSYSAFAGLSLRTKIRV